MPHADSTFSQPGARIAFRDEGDPLGPPLLMIMGLGAQLVFWPRGLVDMLVDAGFRVIRIDNRDTGESSHFDEYGTPRLTTTLARRALGMPLRAPYDLYDMAGDAVAVLDRLRIERAHVVGSSMGGMIAQILASRHGHRVLTLTSIMSSCGDLRDMVPSPRACRIFLRSRPKTDDAKAEQIVRTYQAIAGRRWGRDERILREIASEAVARGYNPRAFPRQIAAIAKTGSRTRELASIAVPTQILHGTQDPLVRPAAARKLAAAIPGARLRWIEGMGHGLPRPAWPLLVGFIADHARQVDARPVSAGAARLR
jgi:pimeloyl-ACP methyl ester carboxylesterase